MNEAQLTARLATLTNNHLLERFMIYHALKFLPPHHTQKNTNKQ